MILTPLSSWALLVLLTITSFAVGNCLARWGNSDSGKE